ncbi:PAN2-PAN3 deadenylation complex subunit PAN3 [Pieris brassicae]|nr:PAN2-PAN3 deadenylation complex subunit PAN3 [Pieris brassicae]XP_045530752.1 PAN2-PAN3 deadenylation complex subunit PAN3 [Pieris brassicae]XP_045530753.1 PAN2-PAN3 deadenylation complex subunit PAN3 [Pieris brassicae]
MDPSIYLPYSPPSLPQESKLMTYMNRNNISTPTRSLNQSYNKLTLESSPPSARKVYVGECIPIKYYTSVAMLPESPSNTPPHLPAPQIHQENVGGTTYFYPTNDVNVSLNSSGGLNSSGLIGGSEHNMAVPSMAYPQMYAPIPASPIQGLGDTFYMPEQIRSEMQQIAQDPYTQPNTRQCQNLPNSLEDYTELLPLEELSPHSNTTSFRATHRIHGDQYALRRLHSYGTVPSKRFQSWKQIDHPNIIRLNHWFTTRAFGDHSMVIVYDYHPASVTLMQRYLDSRTPGSNAAANGSYHDPFSSDPDAPRPYTHQKNAMLRAVAGGSLLPEAVLWSILVQLTAGLRAIHAAGLACRTLDPTKVLTMGCRIRIAWCGVADALHANEIDINQAQQDDLTALGRLTLALACRTIHCDNLPLSIELVSRTYSVDLKNLIIYLLSAPRRSVTDLMPMIGARFYTQVEAFERRTDILESHLARELDNGRMLRLLMKICFIIERPEFNRDHKWAETGNRYLLKLFRDYLFHSVTTEGRPWLDLSHVSNCLNQLDSGTEIQVGLMTRDEGSVLLVTYAELKHCLDQAFAELMQVTPPSP